MFTERHPPERSSISTKLIPRGAAYTWPVEPQDTISGETMRALFVLVLAIVFLGYVFTVLFEGGSYESIDKGIEFKHLFIGFLHLIILAVIIQQGRTMYLILRRPLPASLELTPNEIIYRTGTRRLQLQFGSGSYRGRLQRTKETAGRLTNKSYVFPLREQENFTLEKTGDSLSLSIKYRGRRIEIADTLNESDKEWLYKFLKAYKTD